MIGHFLAMLALIAVAVAAADWLGDAGRGWLKLARWLAFFILFGGYTLAVAAVFGGAAGVAELLSH